jgi:hypothetical protein
MLGLAETSPSNLRRVAMPYRPGCLRLPDMPDQRGARTANRVSDGSSDPREGSGSADAWLVESVTNNVEGGRREGEAEGEAEAEGDGDGDGLEGTPATCAR